MSRLLKSEVVPKLRKPTKREATLQEKIDKLTLKVGGYQNGLVKLASLLAPFLKDEMYAVAEEAVDAHRYW